MAGASKITLRVTGKVVGYAYTQNFQDSADRNLYLVPTYLMELQWEKNGDIYRCKYEVIRFGPAYNKDENTGELRLSNSGLKDAQRYNIDGWDPAYETTIRKKGALHVRYFDKDKSYLVHAGPDDAQARPANIIDAPGAAGCIEVCGKGQWEALIKKIWELTGLKPKDLMGLTPEEVADKLGVAIVYDPVARYPPMFKELGSASKEAWDKELKKFKASEEMRGINTDERLQPTCQIYRIPARYLWEPALVAVSFERDDPLVLDLNGDGIITTNLEDGAYFDHNADGFAEQTSWVGPDDGVLAMDRNGNSFIDDGGELFGNGTILSNGTKASNGFKALAAFDGNGDGKIDAADPIFKELLVWQDWDSDGYSSYDELWTLEERGIKSIDLHSTVTQVTDEQGNTQNRLGSFEWVDGTTGQIGEYTFQRDTMYTIATDSLPVPADIASLPDLDGYGNVYDLQQAMVRDASGQLEAFVNQFIAATEVSERNSLMNQILFKWTGSENVDPTSRGRFIDARKLGVLEKIYGQAFVGAAGPNPTEAGGGLLQQSYHRLFEMMYSQLMYQTHLKDLFDMVWCGLCEETNSMKADLSVVIYELNNQLATDPVQGRLLLSEFARSVRGLQLVDTGDYLSFREAFIQQDPSLGWVIDSGGLPVYDQLGQGDGWWYPHMWGTWNSDAVKGSATQGDGYINGLTGDDVIYGTDRNEYLLNQAGDALLVGGGGSDQIWAGEGNDILDGGTGNDRLFGEAGNDTYIFRRGSGQDIIIDPDPTADNADTIWLGSNLTPDEIVLRRSGNNLVLKIIDTTDTLTVQDYFRNDSPLNRIEQIQFMDGTVWTHDDLHGVAA